MISNETRFTHALLTAISCIKYQEITTYISSINALNVLKTQKSLIKSFFTGKAFNHENP